MAKITLAFDVYGTLIDTNGVLTLLENFIGEKAKAFSSTWRDKQLEYSFRRGHMQNYVSFAVCTQQALDYTCLFYKEDLSKEQRTELMAIYAVLPSFKEVKVALEKFKEKGFRLFAFSNGKKEAVEKLLNNAGIIDLFDGVVSVDDIKTFKPSPGAYAHFLRSANAKSGESWLISSNPFDVTGSISAGMRSAWIQRSSEAIFDPWEIQPTIKVNSLSELTNRISN
ncbi:MAG: haloacid dehalogenase type II [Arcobacter sp.]|nr:haloacid dehalogenase type II [Arcobacter sp.]|tara:strand:- start:1223 stop:1897 length:675 start_codon:yes stop_codon:yes gene_type:complete